MRVFVHLASGMGAVEWERRWTAGRKGMNDPQPYGYSRAASERVIVVYSKDSPEGRILRYARSFVRLMLGFDLLHAWRNRAGIMAADVVWTHTESQHLAIGLLFFLTGKSRRHVRPKLIGQSVWLFDNWKRYTAPRRWFFKLLLRQSDLLTVLSPANLQVLRAILPEAKSEFVRYGVRAESQEFALPAPRIAPQPVRVLSMGNDRDRDWPTLVEALGDQPGIELVIGSRTAQKAVRGCRNITVRTLEIKDEILALYAWADVVVVPLKPNLHASGITVIEEAAIRGVPVICTDTGGLRAYFDDQAVAYVPPGDPMAMREAVATLRADHAQRLRMAACAQARMGPDGLSAAAYAQFHVEQSRQLLKRTVSSPSK